MTSQTPMKQPMDMMNPTTPLKNKPGKTTNSKTVYDDPGDWRD
ncbi:MAG: hypothetical protein ACRC26_01655 [Bacteroidales bacterium]